MKKIIIISALVVILITLLIILLPKPIDREWYWSRDYRVDSCYYCKTYYDNNTTSISQYCVASNDTLYILQPYNGTEIKKFRVKVEVYNQTKKDFWDWYFDPLSPLSPISPLSPLNPIHID